MKSRDQAVVELAARQHWAFSREQAVDLGFPPGTCDRRLQRGEWLKGVHPGVYVLPGHTVSWHQRVMSGVLAAPEGAVASHRSAAVLHGVREGSPVEIIVPPGANRRGAALAHRGALERRDRVVLVGIPATAIDRTLVDLAAVVDDRVLEQACEAAFRLGLTTPERVEQRLGELAAPGRVGVARLRRVLKRRARGRAAGSVIEVRVMQLLRDAGLGEPVRQYEIVIGGKRYFLDLAYPEERLVIEVDGEESHGGVQFQGDRARQNALVLAGWTVLRFTWADVMEQPDRLVAVVAMAKAA